MARPKVGVVIAERGYAVRLSANVDAYVAAMDKAKASTSGFSATSQANLQKVGGQMQQVGGSLTRHVTLPLAAAAGVAVHSAARFDTAFSEMVGLAGVAADEVDGLRESVLDLAGRTAVAPQELAEALYFASSAGLDAAQAMEAVELAAKASAAGMGSAKDIVGLVASATAAYGAANITAAEATDILTATIREGRADPQELAGSLGSILPTAAALGVSFDQVGGAVAYLSNIFGDTSKTVTSMSGVLEKLNNPTKQGSDALASMGTSVEELHAAIDERGLLGALELLRERGFDSNTQAVAALFDDVEARRGALALLADESGSLANVMGETADATGDMGDAFEQAAISDGFKLRKSIAEMKVAMIQAGDVIMPIASGIAGGAGDIASAFARLPKPAQMVVLSFLAVVAAVGPLLSIGGRLVANLKTIQAGFTRLSSAGPSAAAGMGVAAVAAIGFGLHAKKAADNARDFADSLDELSRASDAERVDMFGRALTQGALAGKDMTAVVDELTRGNIGLTETLIDQIQTEGIAGASAEGVAQVLDALIASRNREIVALSEQAEQQDRTTAATDAATGVTDELGVAVDGTAAKTENLTAMMEGGITTTDAATQAEAALIVQHDLAADAAVAQAEALDELIAKLLAAVGSVFDLEKATLNLDSSYAAYQESILETMGILGDSEATDREKEQALRDLREQELAVAADALATAEAYAAEQGAAEGSAEAAQLQKDKLLELAARFPELRDEIQLYIDKINAVPGVIRTRFEITATGATVTPHGDFIGIGGPRAAGGPTYRGRLHEVTERGSELLHEGDRTYLLAAANGYITPNNMMSAWTGWGNGGAAPRGDTSMTGVRIDRATFVESVDVDAVMRVANFHLAGVS